MNLFRLLLLCVVLLVANSSLDPAVGYAAAPSRAAVRGFQLLTPNDGWLWLDQQLYWTTDGGSRWSEITPAVAQAQPMRAVFFLDAAQGWLLRGAGDAYTLARTADGGRSWQLHTLTLFATDDPNQHNDAAYLHFVDARTGWLMLKRVTSSAFSVGALFRTEDGGATWIPLDAPIAAPMKFLDAQVGWLAGGPAGDALYRTADGGRTWSLQSVANAATRTVYHLPTFDNARSGVLPVAVQDGAQTRVEFYRSADDGATWQPALTLAVSDEPAAGTHVPLSVADAQHWLVAVPHQPQLLSVTAQRDVTRLASAGDASAIIALHMATNEAGWAHAARGQCARAADGATRCTQTNQLLRTRDGGRSWQPLALPSAAQTADQTTTFTGQGFDSCSAPSVAQMQNWLGSSPYRVWNLYLGGSSLYTGCTPLTLSYVSQLAQQGWQFIPTWVGPQAPCTSYRSRFSADPTTAYAQGVSEANAALERAAAVGLTPADRTGTLIYFDLEYFSPGDAACRQAAQAFISGWVGQLRARDNKAGLYAHYKVMSDFAQIANVPDSVWIAYWQTPYAYDSSASVWGIPNLSDSLWSSQQRLRQYTGGHNETWGGVTLNIDSDVADGVVAALPCYTLSVNTTSSVAGSAVMLSAPNCGSAYIAGTAVQVEAYPNAGYLFAGWGGSASGPSNPLTLVMDGDKNLSASFAAIQSRVLLPFVRR